MSNVLVTGGAGFIGRHLVVALLDKGHQVSVIDNKIEFPVKGRAEWYKHDICGQKRIFQMLLNGVDIIYHLAAIPNVQKSWQIPEKVHNVNATGTLNVLLNALAAGVKRVVYASSSSVYGDTETLPKREDMPVMPLSPYAVSKLAGENYCNAYNGHDGKNGNILTTVCLRYFNVYGKGQSPDSAAVIPSMLRAYQNNEVATIYGDGNQTRDFTYVKDVVNGTIRAGESNCTGVYNIGGGNRYSINDLTNYLSMTTGKYPSEVKYTDRRPGDILDSYADISKAKRDFGYIPDFNLENGLHDMTQEDHGQEK